MSALGEAARIFVTVGFDGGKATTGLKDLGKSIDSFNGKVNAYKTAMGGAFSGPMQMLGNIGDAMDGFKGIAGAVSGLAQSLLGGAARNEQYATSFEVLLGSSAKAQQKLAELRQFANTTPFTLPGVVEASKMLEVMGGSALNTDANLRMVGDAASFAGQDIKDVAVYFGRLYDGIKNGTPIGEATMRLQEMGIMSGQSRLQMTELADAVKGGTMSMADAWKTAGGAFKRFAGQTAKQAETLNGLWSTFTDSIDDGLARVGTRLLPMVKPALKAVTDGMNKLADAAIYVLDNFDKFGPYIIGALIPIIAVLTGAVWNLAAAVVAATWPFLAIGAALAGVAAALVYLFPNVDFLAVAFNVLTTVAYVFQEAVRGVLVVLGQLGDIASWFVTTFTPVGDVVAATGDKVAASVVYIGKSIEDLPGKLADDSSMMETAAAAFFGPVATEASKEAAKAKWSFEGMVAGIIKSFNDARAALLAAASGVADASTRPLVIAAEIMKTQQAIIEAEALVHGTKLGTIAHTAAVAQLATLKGDLLKLTTEQRTFGSWSEKIASASGFLTSKAYLAGIKDKNPEIRANWVNLGIATDTQLQRDIKQARVDGMAQGAALAGGVKSSLPADGLLNGWGRRLGDEFGEGVSKGIQENVHDWRSKIALLKPLVESDSPPGPKSPLHKIDVWGERTGEAWAMGVSSGMGAAPTASRAAMAPSAAAMSSASAGRGAGSGPVTVVYAPQIALSLASPAEMERASRTLTQLVGTGLGMTGRLTPFPEF